MDKVTIETTIDKVLVKKVGKAKGGQVGHIYVPKELIGQKVRIVKEDD